MALKTPQWNYNKFTDWSSYPVLSIAVVVAILCGILVYRAIVIAGRVLGNKQTSSDSFAKELVVLAFGAIVQDRSSTPEETTKSQKTKCLHVGRFQANDASCEAAAILFLMSLLLFAIVSSVSVFWHLFLFKESNRACCVPDLACFAVFNNSTTLHPDSSSRPLLCNPNQCLPDDYANVTANIECFQLVLEYPLAGGVAVGMFSLLTTLVRASLYCVTKLWVKFGKTAILLQTAIFFLITIAFGALWLVPGISGVIWANPENTLQYISAYLQLGFGFVFPISWWFKTPTESENTEMTEASGYTADDSNEDVLIINNTPQQHGYQST